MAPHAGGSAGQHASGEGMTARLVPQASFEGWNVAYAGDLLQVGSWPVVQLPIPSSSVPVSSHRMLLSVRTESYSCSDHVLAWLKGRINTSKDFAASCSRVFTRKRAGRNSIRCQCLENGLLGHCAARSRTQR